MVSQAVSEHNGKMHLHLAYIMIFEKRNVKKYVIFFFLRDACCYFFCNKSAFRQKLSYFTVIVRPLLSKHLGVALQVRYESFSSCWFNFFLFAFHTLHKIACVVRIQLLFKNVYTLHKMMSEESAYIELFLKSVSCDQYHRMKCKKQLVSKKKKNSGLVWV